jgi:hypothetical protein
VELAITCTLLEASQRSPKSNSKVGCTALVCPNVYSLSTADLSKASAKIQEQIPGRGKEAKKEGEKWASEAGAKLDSAVSIPRVLFVADVVLLSSATILLALTSYKRRYGIKEHC